MDDKDMVSKVKKSLAVKFLALLCAAFGLFGFVLFMVFSSKPKEAADLSGFVLNEEMKEGRYVRLETDTAPVAVAPSLEKESQFYYVTDRNGRKYVVNMSSETFKSIMETWDQETGKLQEAYQIKGEIRSIDERVKGMALSNSYKAFPGEEVNEENFPEYLGEFYIKEKILGRRMNTVYTVLTMIGVFFLVLAFGHVVPAMVKAGKGDFGMFDEKNMMQALKKYLPEGESVLAGVHGVGNETNIKMIFKNCVYDGDMTLLFDKNAGMVQVTKGKVCKFDVYVGVTQNHLVLSECERYKHFYEFENIFAAEETDVTELTANVSLQDIGNCFPLADVKSCEVKNIWMGAINCTITMKNGSYLKLMLPKRGGAGMPRQKEHRDKILSRLGAGVL